MPLSAEERDRLEELLAPYKRDADVLSMKRFTQHGSVSTFDHCQAVAELSYLLARRLPWKVDEKIVAAGAFLHDFYLYDWHGSGWRHSYRHAGRACENAVARFGIDEATQEVIRCHMWPISPTRVPRTWEAVIVGLSDKLVSLHETLFKRAGS